MQLEQIAIALRRRTPWEALDLGRVMLREWASPAYRLWFLTYWPVGLALGLIFQSMPWLPLLLMWWLKPLFDRVLLFVYSRSLFGSPAGFKEFRLSLGSLFRHSGLLYGLTLGRLSMARSFVLPVWQLEGMRGKAARQRAKVLSRRTREYGTLLTIICYHAGFIFYMALGILIVFLIPEGVSETLDFNWWLYNADADWLNFLSLCVYMVAETLVEPFFVASGFSLYLNRRSDLEGWDIELAFRRLNARLVSIGKTVVTLLVVGLFVCLGAFSDIAHATEVLESVNAPKPLSPVSIQEQNHEESRAREAINQVVAHPDFGGMTKTTEWRKIPKEKKETSDKRFFNGDWLKNLIRFIEWLSVAGRWLMWIVAGIIVVGLIYLLVVHRERWFGSSQKETAPPDFLFGLDVRPTSLPDDIAAAAHALVLAGKIEEALSLLYRGTLMRLVRYARIEFKPGDTEKDCRARISGKIGTGSATYFGNLLDVWLNTVYAKKTPSRETLESLCQHWNAHFLQPAEMTRPVKEPLA